MNGMLRSVLLVLLLGCVLSACQPRTERQLVTFSGPIMGTDYRIKVVFPADQNSAKPRLEKLEQGLLAQLNAVNAHMSTYLEDSELSQFNRSAANTEFVLSEALRQVIDEALSIAELSQGAFDITVAQAVDLWGFGADGRITQLPNPQQIAHVRQSTGYKKLTLDGNRLSKTHKQTAIDLSAIAKGFAVDQVARYLHSQKLPDFLINVGGELRASGVNSDSKAWRVAIERPQTLGGVQQVVELQDAAIATSGDYRNYVVIDGKKFSHTIDPHSLQPVTHRLASVSVVSAQASTADALATTLLVMGEKRGLAFAKANDLAAYFIVRGDQDGQFHISSTDKFTAILR